MMNNKIIEFKDMEIGDRFECWGDSIGLYNYPKDCVLEKDGDCSAVEIVDDVRTNYRVGVSPTDKFSVINSKNTLDKPD